MHNTVKIIFLLTFFFVFYTYLGYPLIMWILMKLKRKSSVNKKFITPNISIVISAYNEEKSIQEKLENLASLNYPQDKLEVVIISDASSDKTDEIVKNFAQEGKLKIKFYRQPSRRGKIAGYRKVYPHLEGEIIIFTDATSILEKDSLLYLVSNFADESVGCVGGLIKYVNPAKASVGEAEGIYWKYEKKIRELESALCSLPSVSGTFYAVRKELYPYKMREWLADDLVVPIYVKKQGFHTVLDEKAICYERTVSSIKEEIAKRVRITIQNIRGLIEQKDILNPFKYGLFSLIIISHKLFRLLVPIFLVILFVSNLFLLQTSGIFLGLFLLQIIFYLIGAGGHFMKRQHKLINSLFYFCLSNWAILLGIIRYLKGEKVITWEPVR